MYRPYKNSTTLPYTPITHTRRTAHALSKKKESSASLCVHEFCQDMKRASELMTNKRRVINIIRCKRASCALCLGHNKPGPRPGCEHFRDLSSWRAPGTVVTIKSSFTDTLSEPWRVPVGARTGYRKRPVLISLKNVTGARCHAILSIPSISGFPSGSAQEGA